MATPPASIPSASSPAPSPVVLERLVLTADLSEAPAKWEKVFFAPFGKRRGELGFRFFHESTNSQPPSFAVAADGSFWIADRWKDRLAHYSATGEFLDAIAIGEPPPALSIGRGHERIRDLVFSSGRMYALLDPTGGPVVGVDPNGSVQYLRPRLQDQNLWVAEIFPSEGPLEMLVGGFVDADNGFVQDGPQGFFRWNPPGSPERLPGLPSSEDTWLDLKSVPSSSGGDQDFELRFLGLGGTSVQPLHVDVRTRPGPRGRSVQAEVGPGNLIVAKGDLLMYVMLSPSHPRDATRFGGGRWLLRLGRSPVLWERLPMPGLSDEPQSRHLALGPDGSIYLMVAEKGGMLLLRRP
jgi:hypothetical protein